MTNKCAKCEDRGYIFKRFYRGINDKVPHPSETFVRGADDEEDFYVSRAPCPECGRYVFLATIWNPRTSRKELAECEEVSEGNFIMHQPSPHFGKDSPYQLLLERCDMRVEPMPDGSFSVKRFPRRRHDS